MVSYKMVSFVMLVILLELFTYLDSVLLPNKTGMFMIFLGPVLAVFFWFFTREYIEVGSFALSKVLTCDLQVWLGLAIALGAPLGYTFAVVFHSIALGIGTGILGAIVLPILLNAAVNLYLIERKLERWGF